MPLSHPSRALQVGISRFESLGSSTVFWYHSGMKRKHRATLLLIFKRPVSGSVPWADIEALFRALGAEIIEREGSRIAVVLFGQIRVFHRPHPSPMTDKGAVASVRSWLLEHGVEP